MIQNSCILEVGHGDGLNDGIVEEGRIVGLLLGFVDGKAQIKKI